MDRSRNRSGGGGAGGVGGWCVCGCLVSSVPFVRLIVVGCVSLSLLIVVPLGFVGRVLSLSCAHSLSSLDRNGRRPTRARGCERDRGGGARVRRRREHHCEGRVWRTRRGGGSGQERTRNGAMEEVFSRVGVTLKEHKRAGHTAGEALFSFKRKVGNEVCVEVCCVLVCDSWLSFV